MKTKQIKLSSTKFNNKDLYNKFKMSPSLSNSNFNS